MSVVCSCDGSGPGWCEMEIRGGVTLLSPEDHRRFYGQMMFVDREGYASFRSRSPRRRVRLHAVILRPGEGLESDHRNRNKLDNRRENLRAVRPFINRRNLGLSPKNRCGVRGVYSHPDGRRYVAQIKTNGKQKYLGVYDTVDAARAARAAAELELWGYAR